MFHGCRFTWAVQYFVGAGFSVIPTYSPSDFSADNTVTSTPALFLRNWANLWSAITEVRVIDQQQSGPALVEILNTGFVKDVSQLCLMRYGAHFCVGFAKCAAVWCRCG